MLSAGSLPLVNMKFGKVTNPENIDFRLPLDHPGTKKVLASCNEASGKPEIFVGCAKWNRADLKNFYPPGIKDDLAYYASQFNSIEFNAPFYRIFPPEQYAKWKEKTPAGFRFFPKVFQEISHWKRLKDIDRIVETYQYSISGLEEKLGMVFLQLHENFGPKEFNHVETFIQAWPDYIPLAIEFRHTDWYNDQETSECLYKLLETHHITNIIADTSGRRDLLHMRLTTPYAFVRYVGANHPSDYTRLNDWVDRLGEWQQNGLQRICFFVHQNLEQESPLLAAYFIKKLNAKLGVKHAVPQSLNDQGALF